MIVFLMTFERRDSLPGITRLNLINPVLCVNVVTSANIYK